jgi:hypothetical protein
VFVGKAFGTFQLHHQRVLDKQIRIVFSHTVPLVDYGKRDFCRSPDASEAQLSKQGALVDLSRNPAPSVLETSNTAPSTFSLKESRHVLSALFRKVCRPRVRLLGLGLFFQSFA